MSEQEQPKPGILDALEDIFGTDIKVPTFVLLVQPEGNLDFRVEVLAGFNDRRKDLPVSTYAEFISKYTDFLAMVCRGSREKELRDFTVKRNDGSSKQAKETQE